MAECEKCGFKLRKTDVFCSKCGQPVKKIVDVKTKKDVVTGKKEQPLVEKPQISDELKQKLKKELETSIKAFKRGDITLEEFQTIKKAIAAKAKARMYEEKAAPVIEAPKAVIKPRTKVQKEDIFDLPEIPQEPFEIPMDPIIRTPPKKDVETTFSKAWYIVPILFNVFGGIIAYFALNKIDSKAAKKMVGIGLLSFALLGAVGGYFLLGSDYSPFNTSTPPPNEIVIENLTPPIEELDLTPREVVHPNATNASVADANLLLEDLEEGFYEDTLLSGAISDALDFAKGDSIVAAELKEQGWLENHKAVFKKNLPGEQGIGTAEITVISSVSKFDSNKVSTDYLESQLKSLEAELNKSGYTILDPKLNSTSTMAKKVEPNPDYEITVNYRVFFYKDDFFVDLEVEKVGRGLEEEKVLNYASIVEERIR